MRECLFRIAPEMSYDFHSEYKSLLATYEQMSKAAAKAKKEDQLHE